MMIGTPSLNGILADFRNTIKKLDTFVANTQRDIDAKEAKIVRLNDAVSVKLADKTRAQRVKESIAKLIGEP